ncbi:MAG: MBL fold metallo-hydrolase [Anaerolineae bacterium]|nr:MBL fold metallo-hydrolase [Anaerolineae bacterium]
MEITWYGHSCFRMVERGVASIVTDPFDDSTGYEPIRLKADIVTISHQAPSHSSLDSIKGADHILERPGEYEIGGVFITGVATYNLQKIDSTQPNIIFIYDFGSLTVCHLGDLDYVPEQSQIEAFGPIDVLLIPVGGGNALLPGQAAEVISLIEPGVVIPMHYRTPACSRAPEPLDKFLKEMGLQTDLEPVESLKVSSGSSLNETQVVVLRYEH